MRSAIQLPQGVALAALYLVSYVTTLTVKEAIPDALSLLIPTGAIAFIGNWCERSNRLGSRASIFTMAAIAVALGVLLGIT